MVKPVTWFDDSRFKFLKKGVMKKEVKNILRSIEKSEVECEPDFDSKERVIVNVKGKYAIEQSIFDEEIKIPKHLRKNKYRGQGVKLHG